MLVWILLCHINTRLVTYSLKGPWKPWMWKAWCDYGLMKPCVCSMID